MTRSTAEIRVGRIIGSMFADAYGTGSPDVYVCECSHGQPDHEGEDWEGRCVVVGCPCVAYRDREPGDG